MKRTKYLSIIAGLCLLLAPQTARAAEAEKGIDVAGIVFGHIEDSYEWHITDVGDVSVHIPLPVIVKSSTGWHVFSSDRLKDGAEYEGLYIAQEGSHAKKIVERNAAGEEVRPLDISITKNVLALFINSALLVAIMLGCARWYKRHEVNESAPKGGVGMMEATVMYIYEDVVKSCVGAQYRRYAPYLLTAFFFILLNNLMGLVPFFPGGANITGNIAITVVLALFTFVLTNVTRSKEYWKDIFWPNVPTWLKAPVPLMPLIEFIGVFTKPFTLAMRLFANLMAGHAGILSIICIIFITAQLGAGICSSMSFIAIIFGIFLNALEVLVAFIQAYVFTLLSAIFIGIAHPQAETTTENK